MKRVWQLVLTHACINQRYRPILEFIYIQHGAFTGLKLSLSHMLLSMDVFTIMEDDFFFRNHFSVTED